jgi:hypothetical protein
VDKTDPLADGGKQNETEKAAGRVVASRSNRRLVIFDSG